MRLNNALLPFIMASLLFSAGCKKSMPLAEYQRWVQSEQSLMQKVSLGGIQYKAKLIPSEWMCVMQNRHLAENPDSLKTQLPEYQKHRYFSVDIYSEENGAKKSIFSLTHNDEEYAALNRYLLESQNRFRLIVNNDTLYPVFYQLERTYDLSPYNTLNLAFYLEETGEEPGPMRLQYEEEWFNHGRVEYTWTEKEITSIPQLKL